MKLKGTRESGDTLICVAPLQRTHLYICLLLQTEHVDLLLVLIINVGSFAQQQLSHLLPLGMG